MSTLKEKIAVMQAALDGAEIEFRPADTEHPWMINSDPLFGWNEYDYRIKPQPKEIWVNEYPTIAPQLHCSLEDAERCMGNGGITRHYREVME